MESRKAEAEARREAMKKSYKEEGKEKKEKREKKERD
jgi:hypothetical protein